MAATVRKDSTEHICIDPVHLNEALLRRHHPLKTVEQEITDMPQAKVFNILDADAICKHLIYTILTGWPDPYKDLPHDIHPF